MCMGLYMCVSVSVGVMMPIRFRPCQVLYVVQMSLVLDMGEQKQKDEEFLKGQGRGGVHVCMVMDMGKGMGEYVFDRGDGGDFQRSHGNLME